MSRKDRESRLQYHREYYARNREHLVEYARSWRKDEKTKPGRRASTRRAHLKRAYGMTEADLEEMLKKQGGRCAICGTEDPQSRYGQFHIDHDHSSGQVRGLLCHNCNMGLGSFKEDRARMKAAISYLEMFDNVGKENGDGSGRSV